MLKYYFTLIAMALTLACAPPQLPQASKVVYDQTTFLHAIDKLQDTAIAANHKIPSQLSDEAEVAIIRFSLGAADAVKASDSGWQALVRTLWADARKALSDAQKVQLKVVLDVVQGLIDVLPVGGSHGSR